MWSLRLDGSCSAALAREMNQVTMVSLHCVNAAQCPVVVVHSHGDG